MGNYTGSLQQNLWLLKEGANRGWSAINAQPALTGQTAQQGAVENVVNQVGGDKVYKGPVFGQVMPYAQTWNALKPAFEQEAYSMINPESRRALTDAMSAYMNQQASQGGGRFGFRGQGSLLAEAERNRKAQVQDWLNTREQGFQQLFYNPSQEAFNQAIEFGQTPNTPVAPTYEDFMKTYLGKAPVYNTDNSALWTNPTLSGYYGGQQGAFKPNPLLNSTRLFTQVYDGSLVPR
jgi:hypothetical protein